MTSSYKLTVTMSDSNHFLEAGLAESAYIDQNKMELFYYRDNALLEDGNLTFQLHVMRGSARVNVKMCETQEDNDLTASKNCTFTQEELDEDVDL